MTLVIAEAWPCWASSLPPLPRRPAVRRTARRSRASVRRASAASVRCCGCSRATRATSRDVRVTVDGAGPVELRVDGRARHRRARARRCRRPAPRAASGPARAASSADDRAQLPDPGRHPPAEARARPTPRSTARRPSSRAAPRRARRCCVRWKGGELYAQGPSGQFSIDPGLPDGRTIVRVTARDPVGNARGCAGRRSWSTDGAGRRPLLACRRCSTQATTELSGSVDDTTPSTLRATLDGQSIALRGADGQQLRFAPKGATRWSVPLQTPRRGRARPDADRDGRSAEPGAGRTALHGRLDREAASRHHAARSAPAAGTSPSSSAGSPARGCGRAGRRASTTCAPPPRSSATRRSTRCRRRASRTPP